MNHEEVRRLYEEQGSAFLGYACALLGVRASAQDVLHTVFLKLMNEKEIISNPVPYVYRALRNTALNVQRQESRLIPLEDEAAWFEPISLMSEVALAVQEALLALPSEQREVVVLHLWSEMTFCEIAALIRIPSDTAASRYRYALSKLRELLRPLEVADERN
jgi:RNA polymerase sigma-70 factor (ECF subfamily)